MKISIIIVSYNCGGLLLKQCVESCILNLRNLNCSYDKEIIIGDDGSNDDSLSAIKELTQKYPKIVQYFVMDRNIKGKFVPSSRVSALLKKAFSISKGDYIQVLSADDLIINQDKIKRSITFLDNNKNYASCHSDFVMFWDDKTVEYPVSNGHDFSRGVLWSNSYKHISCYVFRRSVFENLLDTFCDDSGLILSCFLTGKTKYLRGEISFAYRQRPKSIMHTSNKVSNYALDVLIIEEIINKKNKLYYASKARLFIPLRYLFLNRKLLKEEENTIFVNSELDNGLLTFLNRYDEQFIFTKVKFHILLINCFICKIIYKLFYLVQKAMR